MTFAAVEPGVDLGRHADELRRVHDAVLSGVRPASRPRPVVARSWQRVLGAGVAPDGSGRRTALSEAEVQRRRASSPLRHVVEGLFGSLAAAADASQLLVVVTDADGVILWRRGSVGIRRRADTLGFAEGAPWTEERVGTNAIGTALAECAPVQLFSAEHFEQHQHPWFCTASPVHDPASGELVGIFDISGPALTLHPAVTALVEMAVRLAQATLWDHLQQRHERLRRSAEPVLAGVRDPLLLVDGHGWVVQSNGVRAPDRVGAPSATVAQMVPGVGLCVPEPIGDGWLLRRLEQDSTLEASIEDGAPPVLEVRRGGVPWRVPLTRRRAQILRLLAAAGREGVTARALSIAVFGDVGHEVTVRAEISRMRRTLGALVATGPYRLDESVRFLP
ncbi:GAF domain-containing protein [Aeromicrobium sp. CTD01-1L150]|uniref:GAF domain-containing protein n=1 Tax=Aeromicrobium sp. CTD01-1L150 TaxID=3341830 RepID=UPI0035BFA30A